MAKLRLIEKMEQKAPLASPSLTGTVTAPTPANGTKNTQVATTEFISNGYIPTSGGPITGAITTSFAGDGATIKSSTDNGVHISGGNGTYRYGAELYLRGNNFSGSAGSFSLEAGRNGQAYALQGFTDGRLKWGNGKVGLHSYTVSSSSTASTTQFLGYCSNMAQSESCVLDIYTGHGWNGLADQNFYIKVFIKCGYIGDNPPLTKRFGTMVYRFVPAGRTADDFLIKTTYVNNSTVNVYLWGKHTYKVAFYSIQCLGGNSMWNHVGTDNATVTGTLQESIVYKNF